MSDKTLGIRTNSLQASLYALEGGADGVVFYTPNGFGIDLLRKLKKYCMSKGKRFCIQTNIDLSDYFGTDEPVFDVIIDAVNQTPEFSYWSAKNFKEPFSAQAKEAIETIIRGTEVGTIRKVMEKRAEIIFSKPVAIKDVLCVSDISFEFKNPSSGRSFASVSEVVEIDFPTSKFLTKPLQGTKVLCIERHNMKLEKINENLPLYSKPKDLEIVLENDSVSLNGSSFNLTVQEAKKSTEFNAVLEKVFSANENTMFCLGKLNVINNSSYDNPFVPISDLKLIKRHYYLSLEHEFFKNALDNQEKYIKNGICRQKWN